MSAHGAKRKDLRDFFAVERPLKNHKIQAKEIKCSDANHISGLSIIESFVTPDEESSLLLFLDSQRWRTDLARRVIHYGGTYCLMPPKTATREEKQRIKGTILPAESMPKDFDFLIDRMIGHRLYTNATSPKHCIVNEYRLRQGISAHVENFRFSSPVCGLSLCHGDWMRFHELEQPDDGSVRSGKAAMAKRTGRIEDVWMPPRGLLVMQGDARSKWQHEIVRSSRDRSCNDWRRVSLTFRTDRTSECSNRYMAEALSTST